MFRSGPSVLRSASSQTFLSASSPTSHSSNCRCFAPSPHAAHTPDARSSPPTSPAPEAALSAASIARSHRSGLQVSYNPSVNCQSTRRLYTHSLWSFFLLLPNLSHSALNDHLHKITYTLKKGLRRQSSPQAATLSQNPHPFRRVSYNIFS